MLPDTHLKEYLQEAYVAAVAAQAGYDCEFKRRDYGIDARISEVTEINGKYIASGHDFSVQMKASHLVEYRGIDAVYDLEAEAHNRLYHHKGGTIVLVLFCVPYKAEDRFEMTESYLKLSNCCYWYPRPSKLTTNKSSITIKIPRRQLFTPEACREIMAQVRLGVL